MFISSVCPFFCHWTLNSMPLVLCLATFIFFFLEYKCILITVVSVGGWLFMILFFFVVKGL